MDVHESHCLNCIKLNQCRSSHFALELCPITSCTFNCGAQFHSCKTDEHVLLCPYVRVSCINANFGCLARMLRKDIRIHLPHCPASVVHCCIEWNRWPLHSRHKRLPAQPVLDATRLSAQQLDVALTLRDQRMLSELRTAARSVKSSLINSLTRKYPAVPISPYCGIRSAKPPSAPQPSPITEPHSIDTKLSLDLNQQNVNFLNESQPQCSHQSNLTTSDNQPGLANYPPQSDDDSESSPWQQYKSPPGLCSSVCAKLRQSTEASIEECCHFNQSDEKVEDLQNDAVLQDSFSHTSSPQVDQNAEVEELVEDILQVTLNNQQPQIDLHLVPEEACCASQSASDVSDDSLELSLLNNEWTKGSSAQPDALLILDLNFDSLAPFKPKPKQMFTFRCAQEFRRDEYAAHYHNVHGDIMGSMNGWMERRCPLWQYGCPVVFRRIHPYPYPSRIVFSNLLESFGHLILTNDECDSSVYFNPIELQSFEKHSNFFPLLHLPIEILRKVLQYLDNFSINNVAMTCHRLRSVAVDLLQARGLVSLVWMRSVNENTVRWHECGRRWFFSNSISEINRWQLFDDGQMLNHMKTCEFNDRNVKHDPFFLHGLGSSLYNEINTKPKEHK